MRVQFGRPIGQFQAVKHRCADMLVALEAARAAVWDAARAFDDADEPGWHGGPAARPRHWRPRPAFRCAKDCIQVLGGIGYTWEHDAHLYLKRATALRSLLPDAGGGSGAWSRPRWPRRRADAVDRAAARGRAGSGTRSRAFVADLRPTDRPSGERTLADAGYLVPHWPAPWGLDADADRAAGRSTRS